MNKRQNSATPYRDSAEPKQSVTLRKVLSCILCLGLLLAAVVIISFAKKLAKEKNELDEQLQTCHEEAQAREVGDLLEALCLPPELLNIDAGYRRDARQIRKKMFRRQGREKVMSTRVIPSYPKYWDNYEEVPLSYGDAEDVLTGLFEWEFHQNACKRLQALAKEIENNRGMGLYLSQHSDLYENHVRPLVFRLLEQMPAREKVYATSVLLAAGERSTEFEEALERLYLNPELDGYRRSELRRWLERSAYSDRVSQLEEMRAELEQLWAGTTPELQAEAIFSERDFGRDRYGDPLPYGVLARLGSQRFRSAPGHIRYLGFSQDGNVIQQVVHISEQFVTTFFDAKTGQVVKEFSQAYNHRINGLALPKGGRFLDMGDGTYNGKITVEDLNTGANGGVILYHFGRFSWPRGCWGREGPAKRALEALLRRSWSDAGHSVWMRSFMR